MGSLRFDGVRFVVYSMDHLPRHVHGFYAAAEVIIDLGRGGEVRLAERKDACRPATAKRSDVRFILETAARHFDELTALWEKVHG